MSDSIDLQAIDLHSKLAEFDELWSPRVIGEFNGQSLRLAKLRGEFVWHTHAAEDETFLVLEGRMRFHLRERAANGLLERRVELGPGQLFVVPRGVEHMTAADELASVLIITASDSHTGGSDEDPGGLAPGDLERL